MLLSDNAREGLERMASSKHTFEIALKAWQMAKPADKKKFAEAVLANVQSGVKLIDLVSADWIDMQTAEDIKSDAGF